MAYQISPGVEIVEKDESIYVSPSSTSIGAYAGHFRWGPIGALQTVSDEKELRAEFGGPTQNSRGRDYARSFYTAAGFLQYGDTLRISRAVEVAERAVATTPGEYIEPFATNITFAGATNAYYISDSDDGVSEWGNATEAQVTAAETAVDYDASAAAPNGSALEGEAYIVTVAGDGGGYFTDALAEGDHIFANIDSPASETDWTIISGSPVEFSARHQISTEEQVLSYGKTDAVYGRYAGELANGLDVYFIDQSMWAAEEAAPGTVIPANVLNSLGYAPDTTEWASTLTNSNTVNDELHVVIVDTDGNFGTAGDILEVYTGLSTAKNSKNSYGESNFYRNIINTRSEYIWLSVGSNEQNVTVANYATFAPPFDGLVAPITLQYGVDGSFDVDNIYFTGNGGYDAENVVDALEVFKSDQVEINLLFSEVAGGESFGESLTINDVIDDEIQAIVEDRKDCVGFISAPLSISKDGSTEAKKAKVLEKFAQIGSSSYLVFDSSPGLVYNRDSDSFLWIPLCGHIAGLCARTDEVADPWFSPAGLNRGNLSPKVIRLAYNPSKSDRDDLYSKRINPVVSFPGQGIVLYGDKTAQTKPSAFDRINVRRLFLTIEKAIANFAKYSLFEQNDAFTRAAFINTVNPYLRDIQGRRGIQQFRVVCDESNNTPEIIDRNEMVATIYVNPTRSINFITLNFVATRTGSSFVEITGG